MLRGSVFFKANSEQDKMKSANLEDFLGLMINLYTARVLDASSRFNYNSGKIYRICENGGAPKTRLKSKLG